MLRNAGVAFTQIAAEIDEEDVKSRMLCQGAAPGKIAEKLAELKAMWVSSKYPDALVIGSDQILDFGGSILSKPLSVEQASQHLRVLRGQQHVLISAVALVSAEQLVWRFSGQATLHMRDFSDAYLAAYLDRQGAEILHTVGCYKLESEGVRLFSKIDGDYFTILGMPLVELMDQLTQLGAIE